MALGYSSQDDSLPSVRYLILASDDISEGE